MKRNTKTNRSASYLGAGLAIGAGIGVALDNIGLGIALGLLVGYALGQQGNKPDDDSSDKKS